jgi:hypothetical protein
MAKNSMAKNSMAKNSKTLHRRMRSQKLGRKEELRMMNNKFESISAELDKLLSAYD